MWLHLGLTQFQRAEHWGVPLVGQSMEASNDHILNNYLKMNITI